MTTFSTTVTSIELAIFCSMDTLELCGDLLQPGGQLETPDLVTVILYIYIGSPVI